MFLNRPLNTMNIGMSFQLIGWHILSLLLFLSNFVFSSAFFNNFSVCISGDPREPPERESGHEPEWTQISKSLEIFESLLPRQLCLDRLQQYEQWSGFQLTIFSLGISRVCYRILGATWSMRSWASLTSKWFARENASQFGIKWWTGKS